jgi:hypothetical protein
MGGNNYRAACAYPGASRWGTTTHSTALTPVSAAPGRRLRRWDDPRIHERSLARAHRGGDGLRRRRQASPGVRRRYTARSAISAMRSGASSMAGRSARVLLTGTIHCDGQQREQRRFQRQHERRHDAASTSGAGGANLGSGGGGGASGGVGTSGATSSAGGAADRVATISAIWDPPSIRAAINAALLSAVGRLLLQCRVG